MYKIKIFAAKDEKIMGGKDYEQIHNNLGDDYEYNLREGTIPVDDEHNPFKNEVKFTAEHSLEEFTNYE
jgi:hypothetical protein